MADSENLFKPSLEAVLNKLDPEDGQQIMDYIKTHVLMMREKALLQASVREEKKLLVENAKLKKDIAGLRIQLQEKQRHKADKALPSVAPLPPKTAPSAPVHQPGPSAGAPPPGTSIAPGERARRRRGEKRRAHSAAASFSLGAEPVVDVSRLDLRVGRMLSTRRHPLAQELLVTDVDVGEPAPRTVVSNLEEEPEGGLALLLCNVKPCKLKGVVSQARLLRCSAPCGRMELLAPPPGSAPGDRVTFHSHPGPPDSELSSRERLWETLLPDLQVDARGVANYKGVGFEVKGKGLCRAPTLTNCPIR